MSQRSAWKAWWVLVAALASVVHGFLPQSTTSNFFSSPTTTALHCICVDCARVTNCAAYHFVETKHEQPHMNENPTFEPVNGRCVRVVRINDFVRRRVDGYLAQSGSTIGWLIIYTTHTFLHPLFSPISPTIHVNVRTIRNQKDQQAEAERMWREYKDEENAATKAGDGHGQTVYDFTPVTTMEYDVVACESFVEDKGAWVRNMPEEIKRANPNFVPS